jgi:putative ABC transport system substrate-binding protein
VEGRNIVIESRWAEGKFERLPELAVELVRSKVDVIVTHGTPASLAAHQATTTIPIVLVNVSDPVDSGLVKSLARPGANIMGVTSNTVELSAKHLEMLHTIVPNVTRVAVLVNPDNASYLTILKNIQTAATRVGVTILPVEATTSQQIEKSFPQMVKVKAGALIVVSDGFFIQQARQIAELAAGHRLPSIAQFRLYAEAGVLMSYGTNVADHYRRAATYVDKVLKGAKPADLPVEQPMKFELVINGKTAKVLGLTIPQSLLISADKVIE